MSRYALMELLVSRSNEKIKYAALLGSSSSERARRGEFLLEGARLCSDAALSGISVVRAFFTAQALSRYESYIREITGRCDDCFEISDEAAAKISDTGNSQGVFCICKIRDNKDGEINPSGIYLALENIQDPANTGAICRSAEAIGLDGIIVSGGCDIYNPKALRAAMGSSLRMSVISVDCLPDFISEAGRKGMLTLASVPDAGAEDIRKIKFTSGVVCCVGNEGNGISRETADACEKKVTIPMRGRAESLNASAAAAILAWELKR